MTYSSFRVMRNVDLESSAFDTMGYWIPALAGMTGCEIISGSLN